MIVITGGVGNNRGAHQIFGPFTAFTGGAGDPDISTGGAGWVPLDTLLKQMNRHITVAPGAAKDVNYRGKVDDAGGPTPIFGTRTISGATAKDDSFDAEVTLPQIITLTATTIRNTMVWLDEWGSAASPAASDELYAFQYAVAGHPGVSWYHWGTDFGGASTFGASQIYAPLGGNFIFNTAHTVRADMQTRWPSNAVVKYALIAWKDLGVGTTLEIALEKNASIGAGGDIFPSTPWSIGGAGGTWQAILEVSDSATISANDFVNWRCLRTAGAGTAANIVICLGIATQ